MSKKIDKQLFREGFAGAFPPKQPQKSQTNLEIWLGHPGSKKFLGKSIPLKFAVLAYVTTGGNQSEIARAHGVSRQRVHELVIIARESYGVIVKG